MTKNDSQILANLSSSIKEQSALALKQNLTWKSLFAQQLLKFMICPITPNHRNSWVVSAVSHNDFALPAKGVHVKQRQSSQSRSMVCHLV